MIKAFSKYGFIGVFILSIAFVYFQGAKKIYKEPKLGLDLPRVKKPQLDLDSWFSREWQTEINKFSKRTFGLFNSSLLTYNQLDYTVFKKANAKDVIVGKEGYLYEKAYIDAFYGNDLLSDSLLDVKVKKLAHVKHYFDSIEVKLCVVFAPGKASYYPEYIPDFYKGSIPQETNNSEFEKRFLEEGIPYIDMRNWFLEMKDTAKFPLVSQTGIHWSYFGMLLAADSLINYSEQVSNKDLANIQLGKFQLSEKPRFTDDDIEKGMNLLTAINSQELAYPDFKYETGDFDSVSAILIGDSYGLGLYNRGLFSRSFTDGQFWFYFRNNYKDYENRSELKFENWLSQLKTTDIVFIVCTEATLRKFAFGFVENAFYELFPNHALNKFRRKKVEEYKFNIERNKDLMNRLKIRANQNGISIDKAVELEAQYLYRVNYRKGNYN
jgi:hypothetical protein